MHGVVPTELFVVAEVVVGCTVGRHGNGDATIAGHERYPESTGILGELGGREVFSPKGVVVFESD